MRQVRTICDRCDAEIPSFIGLRVQLTPRTLMGFTKTRELCKSCEKAFREFMSNSNAGVEA